MYGDASRSDPPALQRADRRTARGVSRVRDGRTVLDGLRQAGCLKARFPRSADGWMDVVTLNTSGGVAGGDRAGQRVRSRRRRARDDRGAGGGAVLSGAARGTAVAGAHADRRWRTAPPRSGCRRRPSCSTAARWTGGCDVELADGRLVPGRGERWCSAARRWASAVNRASLRDRIAVSARRRARCCTTRSGSTATVRRHCCDRAAAMRGARATGDRSCMWRRMPRRGSMRCATPLRHATPMGASAWDGMLVARILARRRRLAARGMVAVIGADALRGGRPLPRVWLC